MKKIKINYADTNISTFDERDRLCVSLNEDSTGNTLFELWDEDVSQAFKDGNLRSGKKSMRGLNSDDEVLHRSMFDYAVELGIIEDID